MSKETEASVSIPEDLKEVLCRDLRGYSLRIGFSVELQHGLMGYFPAVISRTKVPVVVFDLNLLMRVWMTLNPLLSKPTPCLYYHNKTQNIAFEVSGRTDEYALSHSQSPPVVPLTGDELRRLFVEYDRPFEWKLGLSGRPEMGEQEFRDRIKDQLTKLANTFSLPFCPELVV